MTETDRLKSPLLAKIPINKQNIIKEWKGKVEKEAKEKGWSCITQHIHLVQENLKEWIDLLTRTSEGEWTYKDLIEIAYYELIRFRDLLEIAEDLELEGDEIAEYDKAKMYFANIAGTIREAEEKSQKGG